MTILTNLIQQEKCGGHKIHLLQIDQRQLQSFLAFLKLLQASVYLKTILYIFIKVGVLLFFALAEDDLYFARDKINVNTFKWFQQSKELSSIGKRIQLNCTRG